MFTFSPFGLISLEYSLLWSHILPLWNKISKKSKTKGLQGKYQVLANIAQREMLNTREKAA
jgi:hypothetical protein